MEMNWYRCPACGFTHQVPAYWSSFSADKEVELPHIVLVTGEICAEQSLLLVTQEDTRDGPDETGRFL